MDFDLCYTSCLKRAIHTLNLALEAMDREWLLVFKSWKPNERHYGALQGFNKSETTVKYGEELVYEFTPYFTAQRREYLGDYTIALPTSRVIRPKLTAFR